jgi:hypothetical protein
MGDARPPATLALTGRLAWRSGPGLLLLISGVAGLTLTLLIGIPALVNRNAVLAILVLGPVDNNQTLAQWTPPTVLSMLLSRAPAAPASSCS